MAPTEKSKALTILYVEDEGVIRKNVETCLGYIFNVKVANNGQEGLDIFNNNEIDLIITDINMPIKNGINMIEDIKKLNKDIPVIITTAYELDVLNKLSYSNSCHYVKKPFDIRKLLQIAMDILKI